MVQGNETLQSKTSYHATPPCAVVNNTCLPPTTYLDELDELQWMETHNYKKSLEDFNIGRPTAFISSSRQLYYGDIKGTIKSHMIKSHGGS